VGRVALPGTNLSVSEVGLGCAKLGGVFQRGNAAEHNAVIQAARELGISFFDTADIYAQGESERILGKALASDRSRVVIASKVGYILARQAPLIDRAKPLLKPIVHRLGLRHAAVPAGIRGGPVAQDFSSIHVVEAVEGSLRRLRTDYLDILFLHSPPQAVLTAGPFVDGVQRLLRDGKIRWFGVSCERAEDAPVALAVPEVSCIQVPLSILEQDAIERSVAPARIANKGVIGRQCLASGFLSGGDPSRHMGVLAPGRRASMASAVAHLAVLARDIERSLPSAALGFSLATPGVCSTLIGAHTAAQLRQAQTWVSEGPVTAEEWNSLRDSVSG
jgi:aryl-alcohol dehydrogenase-like predicted oxidoreductase